ncbi:MAG TPA: hypothetical protein VH814_01635 [Steroidobacteraceae bacterium]|jgi:hypothetical protein
MSRSRSPAFALAAMLLAATAAHASADAVPPALRACTTVKKSSERLACYDQAIARLSSDSEAAADAPEHSAEATFGASASHRDVSAQPIEREELASITAHVSALTHDGSGALVIDLDNGQQWRQTGGSSTPLLEVGHEVTITRAALSSFRMSTPSGRPLKVKRVR